MTLITVKDAGGNDINYKLYTFESVGALGLDVTITLV